MDIYGILFEFILFFGILTILSKVVYVTGKKTLTERNKEWLLAFLGSVVIFIVLKIVLPSPFEYLKEAIFS